MGRDFDHLVRTKPWLLREALNRRKLLLLVLVGHPLRLDLIVGQTLADPEPSYQRISLVRSKTHPLPILDTFHHLAKIALKSPRLGIRKFHGHLLSSIQLLVVTTASGRPHTHLSAPELPALVQS